MGRKIMKMGLWMMVIMGIFMKIAEADMVDREVIHVIGKVMCQDCSGSWNDFVRGAKPINGSKVSITCLDEKRRPAYYGSDRTDDYGEYDIAVDKMVRGKKLNPKNCVVRLVSSPDPICKVATNFAHGKTGVKLRQPSVVYRGLVKYFLGTFYYTTLDCDEPDSTPTPHQHPY